MVNAEGDDVDFPPLLLMNPMAGNHVTALLDELLALDADGLAARAAGETAARFADVPGEFPAALVVADDLKGGWTNRWDYEFNVRFRQGPHAKRFWVTGILWSNVPSWSRNSLRAWTREEPRNGRRRPSWSRELEERGRGSREEWTGGRSEPGSSDGCARMAKPARLGAEAEAELTAAVLWYESSRQEETALVPFPRPSDDRARTRTRPRTR